MARLRKESFGTVEKITDYEKIISFRNVLVHGYDVIDDSTVWSAIIENIPSLLQEIQNLLDVDKQT